MIPLKPLTPLNSVLGLRKELFLLLLKFREVSRLTSLVFIPLLLHVGTEEITLFFWWDKMLLMDRIFMKLETLGENVGEKKVT